MARGRRHISSWRKPLPPAGEAPIETPRFSASLRVLRPDSGRFGGTMDRKFEPVLPGRQSQLPPLPAGMPRAQSADAVLPISQNTVLRNTYWLLSLSLLPTIVGAFVGMQLG